MLITNVKKRLLFFLTVIFISLPLVGMGASNDLRVFDQAGLLSLTEQKNLEGRINKLQQETGLDIIIVTTANTSGKSSRAYADNFYDRNSFGVGQDKSGILLLIDMKNRQVYISTAGKAIDYFTDKRIDQATGIIGPELTKKNYYQGSLRFLEQVDKNVRAGVPTGQYRKAEEPKEPKKKEITLIESIIAFLGAIGFGFVEKSRIKSNYKRGDAAIASEHPLFKNFTLHQERDELVSENTTYTIVEPVCSNDDDDRDDRSTTHTSESGETHGGGGRGF